ncbi:hypothetical protein COK29_31590 [Bacillus cereus]|uniref:hypothetical protein n=1 Tax=Bacillus cereus TaxID=1396 RepID=UPI000BF7EBFC|nr:hypothetical protein [Bacillus cereus]PFR43690.1 hypothetical protein COK29_31590 [Bacillus cereus]
MGNQQFLKMDQLEGIKMDFSEFLLATGISVGKHCNLKIIHANSTFLKEVSGEIIEVFFVTDCLLTININGLINSVNGYKGILNNGYCYYVLDQDNTYTILTI